MMETYRDTRIVSVDRRGATIEVAGRTVLTPWQDLRAAATQFDPELSGRYRAILDIAEAMWRAAAKSQGRLFVLRKFEIGSRFATMWGLARDRNSNPIVKSGLEPFGSATGIRFLQRWADENGYAIASPPGPPRR